MMDLFWLVAGWAGLGFLAYRAVRIWWDAGQQVVEPGRRLAWALHGALTPASYWWGARLEALSADERAGLLARETAALGLSRADAERCPLCGAEVPRAWTLAGEGHPSVAPGPVECPRCDFRLDACRHCAHFLPGMPRGWGQAGWHTDDLTFGRCGHYKRSQPVELACPPDMARQLKARGYDQVRAPAQITDSFVPLASCTAFRPERKRLRQGGIRWPNARRAALLRLLALPPDGDLGRKPSEGQIGKGNP